MERHGCKCEMQVCLDRDIKWNDLMHRPTIIELSIEVKYGFLSLNRITEVIHLR